MRLSIVFIYFKHVCSYSLKHFYDVCFKIFFRSFKHHYHISEVSIDCFSFNHE